LGQIVSDTLGHPQASIDRPDTTFTTGKPFRNKALRSGFAKQLRFLAFWAASLAGLHRSPFSVTS
jgi:hypothetical protein